MRSLLRFMDVPVMTPFVLRQGRYHMPTPKPQRHDDWAVSHLTAKQAAAARAVMDVRAGERTAAQAADFAADLAAMARRWRHARRRVWRDRG